MDSLDAKAVKDLLDDGLAFDFGRDDEDVEKFYEYKEMERYLGLDKPKEMADEGNSVPFEELERTMTNVTADGKIKKKILIKGQKSLPKNSKVFIHFSSYLDHCPAPFDSSRMKSKKPIPFVLDSGTIYPGFEISLKSMMSGEKSQFLVHPDYAFGEIGATPEIPPNSTLLLEIHLVKYTSNDSDPTPDHLKDKFDYIFEKAKNIHQNGNSLFAQAHYKDAIVNYKKAAKLMTDCRLDNDHEERKMKEFLVKTYSNLMITYNKINLPKKVCTYAREALYTFPGLASRHVKINYNLGRAQMALHNFHLARVFLNKAKKFSNSPEIIQALADLDNQIKVSKLADCEFLDEVFNQKAEIDHEFLKARKEIDNLINNNDKLILPKSIDVRSLEMYIKLCQEHNLYMSENSDGDWLIEIDKNDTTEEIDAKDKENIKEIIEESNSEDEIQEVFPDIPITEETPTSDTDVEDVMVDMARDMLAIIDEDDPLILPTDHNKEELEVIKKLAHEKNLIVIEEENNVIIKLS